MNANNSTPEHIEIPLTKGYIAIVSPEDADLAQFKWCAKSSLIRAHEPKCLASRRGGSTDFDLMHRTVLTRKIGRELIPGELCDHINGNPLDNRRENLRVATASQNQQNKARQKNNTSGFKGVSWDKTRKKWRAQIKFHGRHHYIGFFNTPQEAHAAYCTKAKELHGEFANFGSYLSS